MQYLIERSLQALRSNARDVSAHWRLSMREKARERGREREREREAERERRVCSSPAKGEFPKYVLEWPVG